MLWQSYPAQHATTSARTSKPHNGSQTMAPQRRQRPQSATCPHVKVQTGHTISSYGSPASPQCPGHPHNIDTVSCP